MEFNAIQSLEAVLKLPLQKNALNLHGSLIVVLGSLKDEEAVGLDYSIYLMNHLYFDVAEEKLRYLNNQYPENEQLKARLAWSLLEQHKAGWVELVDELSASAIDPSIRQFTDLMFHRAAHIVQQQTNQ